MTPVTVTVDICSQSFTPGDPPASVRPACRRMDDGALRIPSTGSQWLEIIVLESLKCLGFQREVSLKSL